MLNSSFAALNLLWIAIAALAGAVTALSFRGWKEMTKAEIALTLFVGASFAIFVTPWLVHSWWPEASTTTMAAAIYISASGSNTFLPMAIRWFGSKFGEGPSVKEPPE